MPEAILVGIARVHIGALFEKERAPSTGRAPTNNRAPKCDGVCMGSCRGIANMGTADASRRFAYCGLVVGTLPSRRLAAMSLYWLHLATPDKVTNSL